MATLSMPEYHDYSDHALNSLADSLTLLEELLDDDDIDINFSVRAAAHHNKCLSYVAFMTLY
jgi:hypothetical protein